MGLDSIIFGYNLVTKIMLFISSRISIIYAILTIADAIDDGGNYNSNTNNHICKINKIRKDVCTFNESSNIGRIFTNFEQFITNVYNMIKICPIANKRNNFCVIVKRINMIRSNIHLIKTLGLATIMIKELFIIIYNGTSQIANKIQILTIVLMITSYDKFIRKVDKINTCYSITNKMNAYNQYLIITNVIIIHTIMYLIQTLLMIESKIILKMALLYNVCDTGQAAIIAGRLAE